MTYTVYLDEIFIGNVVMNFAILWLTARFSLCRTNKWRLAAAAALGAFYVVTLFVFPLYEFTSLPAKLGLSLAMLVVAFGLLPWRKLLTCGVIFFICSFALGGLVFGLSYLFGGTGTAAGLGPAFSFPTQFFWPVIIAALTAAWLAGRTGAVFLRRRHLKGLFQVPVNIQLYNRRLSVDALIDTGNQLSDPVSKAPVIVVEYDAVKALLPDRVRQLLDSGAEPDFPALIGALESTKLATRFRLIPFQSLGRVNGLLLGFRPDQVEILVGGEMLRVKEVIVAVYQRRLSPEAAYRALLNPRVLEAAPGFL
ncbi:MAG: sigma-E processing peptidase SpoIIGA [Bacillota bacterium]|uniref:sigma-E processing peptidase SpoIIGA n=1 Tax=Desulforudis sp. DRI-14 TaxID=3459793 RepID=UPI0034933B6F